MKNLNLFAFRYAQCESLQPTLDRHTEQTSKDHPSGVSNLSGIMIRTKLQPKVQSCMAGSAGGYLMILPYPRFLLHVLNGVTCVC